MVIETHFYVQLYAIEFFDHCFDRYHLHPKVPPKKMHMFAQIAVAISVDLSIPKLILAEGNSLLKAELERTYVGVYYISSWYDTRVATPRGESSLTTFSVSMVFRKSISMRYDDYVGDCCRSLAEVKNAPTDGDLIHFIGLQRLAEEIATTFGYDSITNEGRYLRIENVELSVKAFKSRLHDLRLSLPSNSRCLGKRPNLGWVLTRG